MSLSDTMGWEREAVTEVPPALGGSEEAASVVVEGSKVELDMEPSVAAGRESKKKQERMIKLQDSGANFDESPVTLCQSQKF